MPATSTNPLKSMATKSFFSSSRGNLQSFLRETQKEIAQLSSSRLPNGKANRNYVRQVPAKSKRRILLFDYGHGLGISVGDIHGAIVGTEKHSVTVYT